MISKKIENIIKQAAIARYPNEACGVIKKVGKKLVAIECENVSTEPHLYFVISPKEYREHIDNGGVYGVWHTHVENPSSPSSTDIAACDRTCVDWFILDIYKSDDGYRFGELTVLKPKSFDTSIYKNRVYSYGVNDCFTLLVDYYRHEFNIDISFRASGYPQLKNWEFGAENMLVDNFEKAGFERLSDTVEPVVGDVFLIQVDHVWPDHVAIYVGDDRILHHCFGRLSEETIYGGSFWQKHTTHILRHKNKS
jgi:proteasome lid subunit RPN8/RPN11